MNASVDRFTEAFFINLIHNKELVKYFIPSPQLQADNNSLISSLDASGHFHTVLY